MQDINRKVSKMGQQEAYYFRCRKSDNIHNEPEQKSVQIVYFLQ